MSTRPIAVLGAGNGGQCMAADLSLMGYSVNLYEQPAFAENLRPLVEAGGIELRGIGRTGRATLNLATTNIEEAIEEAEIIHVVMAAMGHDGTFEALLPHLVDGQMVVCWAADCGSLRLAKLREKHPSRRILIAETNTLPYGTRLAGPGRVDLLLAAPHVLLAALPARDTAAVLERLKPIFPCLAPAQHVLAVAMNNPNPICHPPGSLLNTGRIEYSRGDFYMYREGITHSVARVIRRIYSEISDLAGVLGCEMIRYEERGFWTTASIMGVAFQAPFDTIGVVASVLGPKSVHDRYVVEDLPYGLVPLSELGRKLGVPTPLIDSIIHVGSAVCNVDFWETGRTLRSLGIDGMEKEELLAYLVGG